MVCAWNNSLYKRRLVIILITILLLQLTPAPVSAQGAPVVYSQSGSTAGSRTACELSRQWDAITAPDWRFDVLPSTQYPYAPGRLSADYIQNGLRCVNFFRYSAGLPAVAASDQDNASAQYGAMLLASVDQLTHTPSRPATMSALDYQRGTGALAQSNIALLKYGYGDGVAQQRYEKSMLQATMSYMNEVGTANRATVAHRRWVLYPDLQTVGIGCADVGGNTYHVLKVLGCAQSVCRAPSYDYIAWPASGVFPAQAITQSAPWSVTLNPAKFRSPSRSAITVRISSEDGTSWFLSSATSSDSGKQEFLTVDTHPYGVANSIIFAFPSTSRGLYRGSYHVTVSGLTTADGRPAVLDYTTSFIDMTASCHTWSDWLTVAPASCTESGLAERYCTACGEVERRTVQALGHDWQLAAVLTPAQKYTPGKAAFVCTLCRAEKTDQLPLAPCVEGDCPSNAFSDLPAPTNWEHNGIDYVVERGYFCGTSTTTFSPKGFITRGMLVTVLWRIAGQPAAGTLCGFTDVASSKYYTDAVCWASSVGLVNGFSPTRFAPNSTITREQMVTLLYRFFGGVAPQAQDELLSGFADAVRVQHYAADAMAWAIRSRIIIGAAGRDGELLLSPGNSITREQAASLLMRCMQLQETAEER